MSTEGFISDLVLGLHVFECVFYVEHSSVVHVEKGVKYFLLVLRVLVHGCFDLSFVAGEQQILDLDDLDDILFLPSFRFAPPGFSLCTIVKLKVLKFKVLLILNEFFDSLHINLVKLRDETSTDESMFESKSYFLAIGEDELVEIVKYELE